MRYVRIVVLLSMLLVFVACNPTTGNTPTNTPIVTINPPTDTPEPTELPTEEPTDEPTIEPTVEPTTEPTNDPGVRGVFIPFDEFLQQTRDAQFDDYAGREDARVRDEDAFEAMRQHILSLYDGVEQVSTFVSEGQYFDCITVESQPSLRLLDVELIREAPDGTLADEEGREGEAPGEFEALESPLTLGLTDPFGNPISCDDGTIPFRRITLEELTRFEDLDSFFSKDSNGEGRIPPDPEEVPPDEDDVEHRYAASRQYVTNFGGNSWLNLWNPAIGTDQVFSLSQQWYAGGSGDELQTLEGGWQVYPQKYDTTNAVLFIYYTADNYGDTGCYNLDCAGFVQINNNWYIGGPWSAYSTTGGTQWGFEMQWKLFERNWWLFLKGPGRYEAVGYYPISVYDGGRMTESAERITYGGETTGAGTYPPMGSGAFSADGWQRAAFQHTIFYIPRNENNGVGVWADLFEIEPSPRCYTIDITPASSGGNWGTHIFFGGPGGSPC